MKHIYILLFLCFPLPLWAQHRISYAYDAAGNRVKRCIVMEKPRSASQRGGKNVEYKTFSETIQEHRVKISSNSSNGKISVFITGLKDDDKCSLDIYTTNGGLIERKRLTSDATEINISHRASGVYILKITINSNASTWKIVKE